MNGEFILTFREILIVDTQIASSLTIPESKVRNLGKTQLKEGGKSIAGDS